MVPVEFYTLARRLIDNEPRDAGYRTSISRSYYAAFLTARRFIAEMGAIIPAGANAHERIPAIL